MFALLGSLGVLAGLIGSGWLVLSAGRAARNPERDRAPVRSAMRLMLGGAVMAMLALEAALLFNDFSLEYVANHHARATPFPFNVATGWAALEGSIVLWGLVLGVYAWFLFRSYWTNPDRLAAGALAVIGIIGLFFFGLQATVANPFQVCIEAAANGCLTASPFPWAPAHAPPDGPGPNPLLQNHILMAIHPPLLYLGYVGLSIPFAFAISALAQRLGGTGWLKRSRRSTLVAWTFLTLGILFGGWWAYEVLSWGGYWAWDPVENASFMPWLVATAFLHSALVQIKRGALQAWNFVLVIAAFSLTILGTFLTRSGTIASVHSFTQSAIGPVLLGFLFLVLAGSFGLLASRSHLVANSPRLTSLLSREGGFLLNNLLLTVYAFVVVIGTLYPILIEALSGDRVSVGEPFFNRLAVPLSFGLLLAMGIGPLTPWKEANPKLLADRLRLPLQLGLAAGVLTVLTTSRLGYVVLAVVLGVFVIAAIVALLIERSRRAARARGSKVLQEVRRQLQTEPSFWAGQLAHCGIALVAIGMALAANLGLQAEVGLAPGDTTRFAGYELNYRSPFLFTEPHRRVEGATIEVFRDSQLVTVLTPRANFFGDDTSGITTPAIHSSLAGDLYLTLIDINPGGIVLRLNTSPGIWLLWAGGLVTASGGVWSLRSRRREEVSVAV
jgi:cytochrome c-type biogenesis protein CcmF